MDKIAYAIAICAGAAMIVAGYLLHAPSLNFIGGATVGAFSVKLFAR